MKLYLFLFLLLSSCSSLKKNPDFSQQIKKNASTQDMSVFNEGLVYLDQGRYGLAVKAFKQVADKNKGSDLEWVALYNLASAYKELSHCKKALEVYQLLMPKVIKVENVKGRVYLSLSYVYECLGKKEEALITLKEGAGYASFLPEELRLIEYPGRLSVAYFRMDEAKIAREIKNTLYYNLEKVKKNFRVRSYADINFARYFYIIGRSHVRTDQVVLFDFLKVFWYYQTYLSQSLLLNVEPWSVKAEYELGQLYYKMWEALKKTKDKAPYKQKIKEVLSQLNKISLDSNSSKMRKIYFGLRKKTLSFL